MQDITVSYAQPGCISGCRYRLPDTQELKTSHHPTLHHDYTTLEITPHCVKENERASFRAEIYASAQDASDAAFERCTTIRGKVRASKKAWEQETIPWVIGPCPFFEPVETEHHDRQGMAVDDHAPPSK